MAKKKPDPAAIGASQVRGNLDDTLVGQFFHSFEYPALSTKDVKWQGQVVARPEPGWYLIQLFSFLTGEPTDRLLFNFNKMYDWRFYPDAQSMKDAYDLHLECRKQREPETTH